MEVAERGSGLEAISEKTWPERDERHLSMCPGTIRYLCVRNGHSLKMVGATGLLGAARLALRAAGSKPPAFNLACGQVVEPGLFHVAGSTRMTISKPNCHGTIFLKMV